MYRHVSILYRWFYDRWLATSNTHERESRSNEETFSIYVAHGGPRVSYSRWSALFFLFFFVNFLPFCSSVSLWLISLVANVDLIKLPASKHKNPRSRNVSFSHLRFCPAVSCIVLHNVYRFHSISRFLFYRRVFCSRARLDSSCVFEAAKAKNIYQPSLPLDDRLCSGSKRFYVSPPWNIQREREKEKEKLVRMTPCRICTRLNPHLSWLSGFILARITDTEIQTLG